MRLGHDARLLLRLALQPADLGAGLGRRRREPSRHLLRQGSRAPLLFRLALQLTSLSAAPGGWRSWRPCKDLLRLRTRAPFLLRAALQLPSLGAALGGRRRRGDSSRDRTCCACALALISCSASPTNSQVSALLVKAAATAVESGPAAPGHRRSAPAPPRPPAHQPRRCSWKAAATAVETGPAAALTRVL